jgi:hypothetical protein
VDPRLIDIHALRREMKAQDKRRQQDPDVDPLVPRVWVVYEWIDEPPLWQIVGFTRRRLTLQTLPKIRREVQVGDDATLKLVELQVVQRRGPPVEPPAQYNPIIDRRWLAPQLRGIA